MPHSEYLVVIYVWNRHTQSWWAMQDFEGPNARFHARDWVDGMQRLWLQIQPGRQNRVLTITHRVR
jgi:hypothetical protein